MGIFDSLKKDRPLIEECGEDMEALSPDDFVLDPRYFEWGFSYVEEIKLRVSIIDRLKEAREFLPSGWNFKIWDGYRTLATQEAIYKDYWSRLVEEHKDWTDDQVRAQVEIFVAPASHDKSLPSPHNTGATVDLTLVDDAGNEVDMGTEFDEFREASYSDHFADAVSDSEEEDWHTNRLLLRSAMFKAGFVGYSDEWWHFSYGTQEWAGQTGSVKAIFGSVEL
jgi:zinc D-Ala-D-Ala dipeptidase